MIFINIVVNNDLIFQAEAERLKKKQGQGSGMKTSLLSIQENALKRQREYEQKVFLIMNLVLLVNNILQLVLTIKYKCFSETNMFYGV